MQRKRRLRRNILAVVLAYVVALQGVLGGGFGTLQAFAAQSGTTGPLCRALASADTDRPPAKNHDADQCKLICAAGVCNADQPFDQTGGIVDADPVFATVQLDAPLYSVGSLGRTLTPFPRGPPSPSV